jgi:SWIM zinc finger
MDQLIARWERAAQRAGDEKVRILRIGGQYWATSSSKQLGSYLLQRSSNGWTCECPANREFKVPCKHLWALAEVLALDPLSDMDIEWPPRPVLSAA